MKIEKIVPILAELPSDSWSWVKIETDCGITGWGEYSGNPITHAAVTAIIKVLRRQMVGKDPLQISVCLSQVQNWRHPSFLDDRMVMMAMSALDMALWDIRAKSEGVPIRTLYSDKKVEAIRLYANLNRLLRKEPTLDRLLNLAETAVKDGFEMVKLAPFSEVTPLCRQPDICSGLTRCREVGKAIGLNRIAVDCHCRFTLDTFDMMLQKLGDDVGCIRFFEDPVRIHFDRDIAPVKERWPQIRFASGEDCFSAAELNSLAEGGHISILNPDIKYIGGITAAVELFPGLCSKGVELSLHNPSGPIATAHSAQLSVLCGQQTFLEFAVGDNHARCCTLSNREPVENGWYYLSDKPGIGVEPDQEFLEKFAREEY